MRSLPDVKGRMMFPSFSIDTATIASRGSSMLKNSVCQRKGSSVAKPVTITAMRGMYFPDVFIMYVSFPF